ncbi:20109_t:CDS:2 [Racocetra fulgida]|uniref:N-terminal methionine N(alpha)-acetyltransferase NatE n=1 Tax=Racocetra fulgida TaxID=60492 RepID=A0A9N8ZNF9_9GLOM|nr:20109_t:CDS:2 [Racocetra fulgida]
MKEFIFMGAPTEETSTEAAEHSATNTVDDAAVTNKTTINKKPTTHRIALGDVTHNNLGQLKREKFYKDVLEVGEFAKLGKIETYFNDICVGAVCCRKEPISDTSPEQAKLYIMTLGVLAPYRNLGIAPSTPKFTEIYLHVQVSNEEALAFYKKYAFEIVGTVEGYYKRISPSNAYVLSRKLQECLNSLLSEYIGKKSLIPMDRPAKFREEAIRNLTKQLLKTFSLQDSKQCQLFKETSQNIKERFQRFFECYDIGKDRLKNIYKQH